MDSLGKETEFSIGFPESDDINYVYADLNYDNKADALIYFTPQKCDGGNETTWIQYELLVVSNDPEYKVLDDYFNVLNRGKEGFYHWDSIATNTIYGTFYAFKEGDANCCPSTQKSALINYESKKISFPKSK